MTEDASSFGHIHAVFTFQGGLPSSVEASFMGKSINSLHITNNSPITASRHSRNNLQNQTKNVPKSVHTRAISSHSIFGLISQSTFPNKALILYIFYTEWNASVSVLVEIPAKVLLFYDPVPYLSVSFHSRVNEARVTQD